MMAGRAAERGYCAVHDSSGNSDEDDDESDIHIFAVYQVNGYKITLLMTFGTTGSWVSLLCDSTPQPGFWIWQSLSGHDYCSASLASGQVHPFPSM
jgi:hypothetical protein